MKGFFVFMLVMFATQAMADTSPSRSGVGQNGCYIYTMCDAQTATGACTVSPAAGDERVAVLGDMSNLTLYGNQSSDDAHTCNLHTSDTGYDASSGEGQLVNSSPLTDSAQVISISGLFYHLWVECTTITTQATVTMLVCPAGR